MNEDKRGVTPANVTAMTVEPVGSGWHVIIEQGNGDVIKDIELTSLEAAQLGIMLSSATTYTPLRHVEFVDVFRAVVAT